MRIIFLSDGRSPHTLKWVEALTNEGIKIHLISLTEFNVNSYSHIKDLSIETFGFTDETASRENNSFNKLVYLKALFQIKRSINNFKPDLLHAHYASSFGLLGALSRFKPFIVSAWGSDIYIFPKISILHRKAIEYTLRKADFILSTSKAMAQELGLYTDKKIYLTPFGIDTAKFKPELKTSHAGKSVFVFGTIKTLEKVYGLDILIKAFKICTQRISDKNIKLVIVGRGSEENKLKDLVNELNLIRMVEFTGFVEYSEIEKYHNMLDVAVYPSLNESFGVSVLESAACEKPVIVSSTPGFNEIIDDGISGLKVAVNNVEALAEEMIKLYYDEELRIHLAKNGRAKVINEYSLNSSISRMKEVYSKAVLG